MSLCRSVSALSVVLYAINSPVKCTQLDSRHHIREEKNPPVGGRMSSKKTVSILMNCFMLQFRPSDRKPLRSSYLLAVADGKAWTM